MIKVLGAAQMQACDRAAIEEYRIPGLLLMENAGLQSLDALLDLNGGEVPLSTAVVCGPGNNGGDGFVVARQLHNLGREAVVYLLGDPDRLAGDARHNYEIAQQFGVPVVLVDEADLPDYGGVLANYEFVVDALLGTGIEGPPRPPTAALIEAVNASGVPVLAIDLPSGLNADSGAVAGPAVEATATVALAAIKPCHVLAPATDYCGGISVAEISLPAALIDRAPAALRVVTAEDVAVALPAREPDTHKGSFGRVLAVGGAPGTAGAIALAARGALRSGAGLVEVACPETVYDAVVPAVVEALVHPLPVSEGGQPAASVDDVLAVAETADAVVIGPGLGTGAAAAALVESLAGQLALPLILDADALNALDQNLEALRDAPAARILTPHPGEAARLLGTETAAIQADRPAAAQTLADRSEGIVVLKGYRTLIAAPGEVIAVNPTGNPGMATGGSGDVLAGVVGALVAQGVAPARAAWVGAWLHGAAGDQVAATVGEESLIAGDLADALPAAFATVRDVT